MSAINTSRTRTTVFYASVIVTLLAGIFIVAAYSRQPDGIAPKPVVGDPSKRLGTGDAPSKNPVTIDALDKPAEKSP